MSKKRLYMQTGLILGIGMILAGILGWHLAEERNAWAYQFADRILAETAEKYPGAEDELAQEILSGGLKRPKDSVLGKYGVEEKAFRQKFDNQRIHVSLSAGLAGILLAVCAAETLLVVRYVRKQDQRLEEMETYCEEILNNHYALDLRDNEEGDFSILKNKVYDITVMLNEKNQFLEQNKKETEQLLADISHQLKTPITSLNMMTELLYMDLPQEKRVEFLDNMQKDLMRMEWFVKMILNLAKLDSKTLVLKKKAECAAELSEEVRQYFRAFAEMNGCELKVLCEPKIQVDCDKKWTKEAIQNIVKNAIEHGAREICLSWEENYIYTKLTVSDDGDGMEKEDLPHIFERFYKTKDSREDSVGLGLAFCKSIVEHQGGEVKVWSEKGMGTTFSFKFYKNIGESL